MAIKTIQVIRKFSDVSWGGAETVLWNCSKELSKNGYETEIATTSAFESVRNEKHDCGLNIHYFPYTYALMNLTEDVSLKLDQKGGNPFSLELLKYLKGSDCQLLHCHSMGRIARMTRKAAKALNIPYILTLHGEQKFCDAERLEIVELTKNTYNYGWLFGTYLRGKSYFQQAAGIICHSHQQYKLISRRFPDKLVELIPNGVNPEKFHANKEAGEDFRKKYNISMDKKVILCVSRFDYNKNQRLLLQLLNELEKKNEQAHLVLIGSVSKQSYLDKLERDIQTFRLSDHVTIIKSLATDDPDLVGAYDAADCFIMPSIHEPFGIVCLEAWASGVPVIASDNGGLSELIEHRETGLLFKTNCLESLLDKYYILAKSSSLRERVIKKSGKEIEEKYAWNIVVKKLVNFYKKVENNYHKK